MVRTVLLIYAAAIPIETQPISAVWGTPVRMLGILTAYVWLLDKSICSSPRVRAPKISTTIIAFLVWAFASLLWARDQSAGLIAIGTLSQMVLMLIIIGDVVRSDTYARLLMLSYTLGCVAAAVWSLHKMGYGALSGRLSLFESTGPAHFAASLLPGCMFLAGRLLEADSLVDFVLSVAGLAVLSYAIVLSGTRSALLGLIVGTLFLLALTKKSLTKKSRFRLTVAVLSLVGFILLNDTFRLRFVGTAISSGGSGRLDIWRAGWSIVRSSPLIGVGINGFASSFTGDVIRNVGSVMYVSLMEGRDAHNIYLQLLAELGALGLCLFVVPLVLLYRVVLRKRDSMPIIALATVVAYMAAGLALPILNRKYFWLAIGIAIATACNAGNRKEGLVCADDRCYKNRILRDPAT